MDHSQCNEWNPSKRDQPLGEENGPKYRLTENLNNRLCVCVYMRGGCHSAETEKDAIKQELHLRKQSAKHSYINEHMQTLSNCSRGNEASIL